MFNSYKTEERLIETDTIGFILSLTFGAKDGRSKEQSGEITLCNVSKEDTENIDVGRLCLKAKVWMLAESVKNVPGRVIHTELKSYV